MNLTAEQISALENGVPVSLTVDHTRCVLIREDIFQRVKRVIDYDDADFKPEDAYPAILAAWDQEADPGLDAYQDFKRQP